MRPISNAHSGWAVTRGARVVLCVDLCRCVMRRLLSPSTSSRTRSVAMSRSRRSPSQERRVEPTGENTQLTAATWQTQGRGEGGEEEGNKDANNKKEANEG